MKKLIMLYTIGVTLCAYAVPELPEATNVEPTKFYVSVAGSDGNTGTSPSNAWASISKVEAEMGTLTSAASSNDVVVYFDNESTWLNDTLTITATGSTNGTWITFDGSSWGSGDKATLKATASIGYLINIPYKSASSLFDARVCIKGFDLDGNGYMTYASVYTDNANYVVVEDCEVSSSLVEPGFIFPGQRAIKGSRWPPS